MQPMLQMNSAPDEYQSSPDAESNGTLKMLQDPTFRIVEAAYSSPPILDFLYATMDDEINDPVGSAQDHHTLLDNGHKLVVYLQQRSRHGNHRE